MNILCFGRTGQLGRELMRSTWPDGCSIQFLGRPEIDFSRDDAAGDAVRYFRPDMVVNAIAYTEVDLAESERELAFAVNARTVGQIAKACSTLRARLVHISTDYVFDGSKDSPYIEGDEVSPQNTYGRSKAAGEAAIREMLESYTIFRTAWVFSPFGRNFVKTMLRLSETQPEIKVVADQFGSPTAAGDLARAIVQVLPSLCDGVAEGKIFHLAGEGYASWFEFADRIFGELERRNMPRPRLCAISGAEFPLPARRPANSRLDCGLFAKTFGFRLRPWDIALSDVANELIPAHAALGGLSRQ